MEHERKHTCPKCGESMLCPNYLKVAFFQCHWKSKRTRCYKCEGK